MLVCMYMNMPTCVTELYSMYSNWIPMEAMMLVGEQWIMNRRICPNEQERIFWKYSMPHEGILLVYSNAMLMENRWHGRIFHDMA
jgi:hypothetical protein